MSPGHRLEEPAVFPFIAEDQREIRPTSLDCLGQGIGHSGYVAVRVGRELNSFIRG